MDSTDVVVVGAGNAALCAALAAAEAGAKVIVLERAPEAEAGGNSRFTAGAFRCVYDGVDDLARADARPHRRRGRERGLRDLHARASSSTTWGGSPSTAPTLSSARLLVTESRATMRWMQGRGVRFMPIWGRQAYRVDGRFKFWGGLTVEAWGGGPGLVDTLYRLARDAGIEIALRRAGDGADRRRRRRARRAGSAGRAHRASSPPGRWCWPAAGSSPTPSGARATSGRAGTSPRCAARASTPATASAWRSTSARRPYGNWSGCHAVGWDRNAPEFGDLRSATASRSTPIRWACCSNARGERFVDEGADFRNYTYAKYGRAILAQPGQFAWQVFDAKVAASAARRVPHPPGDAGAAPTRWRSWCAKLEDVDAARGAGDAEGVQRGGEDRRRRSIPTSRTGAARSASRSRSRTGPIRSTRRRSRPSR